MVFICGEKKNYFLISFLEKKMVLLADMRRKYVTDIIRPWKGNVKILSTIRLPE